MKLQLFINQEVSEHPDNILVASGSVVVESPNAESTLESPVLADLGRVQVESPADKVQGESNPNDTTVRFLNTYSL